MKKKQKFSNRILNISYEKKVNKEGTNNILHASIIFRFNESILSAGEIERPMCFPFVNLIEI